MSKPVSIVIFTNDDSTALNETMPMLLSQQYDAAFEVIVVRETRQGNMKDLLEPFLNKYNNLHTTYLPDTPQYVTNEEVEILLGVKAAQYDDIIIVAPSFMPSNNQWLQEAATIIQNEDSGLTAERPILLGKAHLEDKGFFFKRKHSKKVAKLLKPWCKSKGIRRKTLNVSKEDNCMFSIAFIRQQYLDDMNLRDIIYTHSYI